MSNELVISRRQGVRVELTLNRSARHNSLVPELLTALQQELDAIRGNDSVRILVLKANGSSFSTGGDLLHLHRHWGDGGHYADKLVAQLNELIITLFCLPQTVIGIVNGIVTGGSLGLILGCDLTLATSRAEFTPYYTKVGFSPDGGWVAILPDIIGRRRSGHIQAMNKTITAEQALDWGLISELVEPSQLQTAMNETCVRIESHDPESLLNTKRGLFNEQRITSYRAALDAEHRAFLSQYRKEAARDGMAQFLGITPNVTEDASAAQPSREEPC